MGISVKRHIDDIRHLTISEGSQHQHWSPFQYYNFFKVSFIRLENTLFNHSSQLDTNSRPYVLRWALYHLCRYDDYLLAIWYRIFDIGKIFFQIYGVMLDTALFSPITKVISPISLIMGIGYWTKCPAVIINNKSPHFLSWLFISIYSLGGPLFIHVALRGGHSANKFR